MPTGIEGFDEITAGGLPRGQTTLLVGGPGSGKTIFALQTLVNGARKFGEPGIFVAFEENSRQIMRNSASFGWGLQELMDQKLFFIDARMSANLIKTGGFDLSGMLAGLTAKAREMSGANDGQNVRIVFDATDVLLTRMQDPAAEREEVYRIHNWLIENRFSGIITAKVQPNENGLRYTYDFMQYMADCVIELRREVIDRVSHRILSVIKYRGSSFAENEFNMVIGQSGIEVPSLSIFNLDYQVFNERVPTGVEALDNMLTGGYLRGSSVLVTGSPGTAKSTLAGAFTEAVCRRGERALYISFDEGPSEVVRNLASVNIHLEPFRENGQLKMYSSRAEACSAVEHLVQIKRLIREHQPTCMVIDPFSAMVKAGGRHLAKITAQRLIYETKAAGITLFMTSLIDSNDPMTEASPMEISTIADTWIHLSYLVLSGERNRAITIIKSRGTGHSNQVRELILADEGVTLTDVYVAGGEVLMGTMRFEKESAERVARQRHQEEVERKRQALLAEQSEIRAQMEVLQRQLDAYAAEMATLKDEETELVQQRQRVRTEVFRRRSGSSDDPSNEAT